MKIACQERLDLGIDYYYAVKRQITSIQRVWDAILEEKRHYDSVGWLDRSRSFMDSFQLCSYLIPQRVSIGFIDNTPTLSRTASYDSQASTVFYTPEDQEDSDFIQPSGSDESGSEESGSEESDSDEESGPDEDEDINVLALSPWTSDVSFEDVDVDNGRAEIISISSGEGDTDGSNYSDDSGESQFPVEIGSADPLKSVLGGAESHRSKDMDDPLWERLLGLLPKAQQPGQEEAKSSGNVRKRALGESSILDSEGEVPKKRRLGANAASYGEKRARTI